MNFGVTNIQTLTLRDSNYTYVKSYGYVTLVFYVVLFLSISFPQSFKYILAITFSVGTRKKHSKYFMKSPQYAWSTLLYLKWENENTFLYVSQINQKLP